MPLALAGGLYVSFLASMSTLVTSFGRLAEVMSVPSSFSVPVPAAGSDVIFTLNRASLGSLSEKLKLAAVNV